MNYNASAKEPPTTAAPTAEWYRHAGFAKITPDPQTRLPHRGGGLRGPVTQFTRGAHRRLLTRLNQLRTQAIRDGFSITLTYPQEFPTPAESRQHLTRFLNSLKYRFPDCCVVWRLGYQQRGAAHYHLLLLGTPGLSREWVQTTWARVVGSTDQHHVTMGVYMRPVFNINRTILYMGKYDAHPPPANHSGQFWGVMGDWRAYMGEPQRTTITQREYTEFARIKRRLDLSRARRYKDPRRRAAAVRRARYTRPEPTSFSFQGLRDRDFERLLDFLRR